MDMMLLGETVRLVDGEQLLGYWMPSGGSEGVAAVEVFYATVANRFTIVMDTKSSDDDDSAADAGTSIIGTVNITGTGRAMYKFDVTDAMDLVRYRVLVDDGSALAAIMHFQFSQPLWSPN